MCGYKKARTIHVLVVQVAKLMQRPRSEAGCSSSKTEAASSVASSQSLIMEDRPPGLPAKQSEEKVYHLLKKLRFFLFKILFRFLYIKILKRKIVHLWSFFISYQAYRVSLEH